MVVVVKSNTTATPPRTAATMCLWVLANSPVTSHWQCHVAFDLLGGAAADVAVSGGGGVGDVCGGVGGAAAVVVVAVADVAVVVAAVDVAVVVVLVALVVMVVPVVLTNVAVVVGMSSAVVGGSSSGGVGDVGCCSICRTKHNTQIESTTKKWRCHQPTPCPPLSSPRTKMTTHNNKHKKQNYY